MRLTLDLAAKYSAAVVLDLSGQVKYQFDSFQKSATELADEVADAASEFEVTHVIIEDVPYGIRGQGQVKSVLRLQGVLIKALSDADLLDRTLFVDPSRWQRCPDPRFEGVWRGGKEGAEVAALRFGYTPPDLLELHANEIPDKGPERTKARAALKKLATDYNDAFLIGQWSLLLDESTLIENTQPPLI